MRRTSLLAASLSVASALACGSPPPPASAKPAASAPAASGAGAPRADAQANRVVQAALERVAKLRELAAVGPVRGKYVSRAEMVEYVRRQLRTEIPPEVVTASGELLFALDTVGERFDYEQSLLALMGSQLAGYYDPEDETMYLAEDLGGAERRATLAHELVHALQDQHYDLGALVKWHDDASDSQGAVHCLAEGDATSAMMDELLADRGMKAIDLSSSAFGLEARAMTELMPDIAEVPSILKRSIVAPYIDGIELVHFLRRRAGWAAVDAVWKNPPATTEQVLHPEKLLKREAAENVPIPPPPPGGPSKLTYHDVLGEQSIELLFEEWMPRAKAVAAATGWAGDRLGAYVEGRRWAALWRIRYDDEAAAVRGLEAFARGLLRPELDTVASASAARDFVPAATAEAEARPGRLCRERTQRGPFAVQRRGRDIAVVVGPYRRAESHAVSDGRCAQALAWAAAGLGQ